MSVNAQADPAFTSKCVTAVNTAKAYYLNQTQANLDAAVNAAFAFYPMSNAQFSSKLSAMLNSPTEMAKFSSPVSFVQCLGSAAWQYNSCINAYVQQTGDIPPAPFDPSTPCYTPYQNAIIQCAVTHL